MKDYLQTSYFDGLIDDFGIWQHSDGNKILHDEGYALDDAARGLLVVLSLGRNEQSEVLFSYILKSRTNDRFYGFADKNRVFIRNYASDDATGQAIWAAGYAIHKNFNRVKAERLIDSVMPYMNQTKFVRGYAYALLGAVYINKETARFYYEKLRSFFDSADKDWFWPDKTLTYGNGIISYAILRYALIYDDTLAAMFGRKVLLFLEKHCTSRRQRGPIGNDGWHSYESNNPAPNYSQQPIDSAYMIWSWLAAYKISGSPIDKKRYKLWMKWFEGENIANEKMYDQSDMRCFDGIDPWGVHRNSGAESNICLLLSKYMLANDVTI